MRSRLGIPLFASVLFACGLNAVATGSGSDPVAGMEGGAAPPVPCNSVSDCPAPPNDCQVPACDGNTCTTTSVATGTACMAAGGRACDGNGTCAACLVAADCPRWLTTCAASTCASGACGASNVATGGACDDNGGRLCDGKGTCVACVVPTDCPAQTTVCKTNTCPSNACATLDAAKGTPCTDSNGVVCNGSGSCVQQHCANGTQDADETDVDCGGSCGASCKDTGPQQKCLAAGDCVSGVCTGTLCQPPGCSDAVQNGNETDIDCGGAGFNGASACPACPDRKHCAKNTDCVSTSCVGAGPGTCVSCADGVKDGSETDIDCGGPVCDAQGKTCGTGKGCLAAMDCTSGYCPGNTTCQLRPDGTACTADAQCLHGACLGVAAGGRVCCNTGCADQGAPSCGTNGQCKPDGTACTDYASGTACAATCTGSTVKTKNCNGTGTCQAGTTTACAGFLSCNAGGTGCLTSCGPNSAVGDASCANKYWCDGVGAGGCLPGLLAGLPCSRDGQCQSGKCNPGQGRCK